MEQIIQIILDYGLVDQCVNLTLVNLMRVIMKILLENNRFIVHKLSISI